jgi:hypothetical protein
MKPNWPISEIVICSLRKKSSFKTIHTFETAQSWTEFDDIAWNVVKFFLAKLRAGLIGDSSIRSPPPKTWKPISRLPAFYVPRTVHTTIASSAKQSPFGLFLRSEAIIVNKTTKSVLRWAIKGCA